MRGELELNKNNKKYAYNYFTKIVVRETLPPILLRCFCIKIFNVFLCEPLFHHNIVKYEKE